MCVLLIFPLQSIEEDPCPNWGRKKPLIKMISIDDGWEGATIDNKCYKIV